MALAGANMSAIIKALNTAQQTFWEYRTYCNQSFAVQLSRALAEGVDRQVDRLNDILEEYPNVNDARLMSENIKWTAGKRKPTVYGDRIDVTVTERVSIREALEEGRARAFRDVTPRSLPADGSATGLAPVAALPAAAEPAPLASPPNAAGDASLECVKNALAGSAARAERLVAASGTPHQPRRDTERYNAKNAAVSQDDTVIVDVTDCGVTDNTPIIDPLS